MLKKTITYMDYDGNERTEEFHFNLTKAELMEMELGTNGGMQKTINHIINAQDNKRIVEIFKDLILRAHGEKSLDGKRFMKNPALTEAFAQTEAYSELFMELATDADAASKFINGIIPQALAAEIAAQGLQPGV